MCSPRPPAQKPTFNLLETKNLLQLDRVLASGKWRSPVATGAWQDDLLE